MVITNKTKTIANIYYLPTLINVTTTKHEHLNRIHFKNVLFVMPLVVGIIIQIKDKNIV